MPKTDEFNRPHIANPEGITRGMDETKRRVYVNETRALASELPQARVREYPAPPAEYPEERSYISLPKPKQTVAAAAHHKTTFGLTLSSVTTTVAAATLIVVMVVLAQTASPVTVSLFYADDFSFVFEVSATLPDDGSFTAYLTGEGYEAQQTIDGAPFLLFYDLTPDTEYQLTVVDPASDETLFTESYRTPLEGAHFASFEAFYEENSDVDPTVFMYAFVDPETDAPFMTVTLMDRQGRTLFVTDDPLRDQAMYEVPVSGPGEYYAFLRINGEVVAFVYITPPEVVEEPEPYLSLLPFYADEFTLVFSVSTNLPLENSYPAYLTGDGDERELIVDDAPFVIFTDLTPGADYLLTVVDPSDGAVLCSGSYSPPIENGHIVGLEAFYENVDDTEPTVFIYPYRMESDATEAVTVTVVLMDKNGDVLSESDVSIEEQEMVRVSVSGPGDYYAFARVNGEVDAFVCVPPPEEQEPTPSYTVDLFYADEYTLVFSVAGLPGENGYTACLTGDADEYEGERIIDGAPFVIFTDLTPGVDYRLTVVDPASGEDLLPPQDFTTPTEVDHVIGLSAFYDEERYGAPYVIVYPTLSADPGASYMTLYLTDRSGGTLLEEQVPLLADQQDHPVSVDGPGDYYAFVIVEDEVAAFAYIEQPADPLCSVSLFYPGVDMFVFEVSAVLPEEGGFVALLTGDDDEYEGEQIIDGAPFVIFTDLTPGVEYRLTVIDPMSEETLFSDVYMTSIESVYSAGMDMEYAHTGDIDPTVFLYPFFEGAEEYEDTYMTVVLCDGDNNVLFSDYYSVQMLEESIPVSVSGPGTYYAYALIDGEVVFFGCYEAEDDLDGNGAGG